MTDEPTAAGTLSARLAVELAERRRAQLTQYFAAIATALDDPGGEAGADALDLAQQLGRSVADMQQDEASVRRERELRHALAAAGDPDSLASAFREAARAFGKHETSYAELRAQWLAEHARLEAARARAEAAVAHHRALERDLAAAVRAVELRRDPAGLAARDASAREERERASRDASLQRERAQLVRELDRLHRGVVVPAGNPSLVPTERDRLAAAIAELDRELAQLAEPSEVAP